MEKFNTHLLFELFDYAIGISNIIVNETTDAAKIYEKGVKTPKELLKKFYDDLDYKFIYDCVDLEKYYRLAVEKAGKAYEDVPEDQLKDLSYGGSRFKNILGETNVTPVADALVIMWYHLQGVSQSLQKLFEDDPSEESLFEKWLYQKGIEAYDNREFEVKDLQSRGNLEILMVILNQLAGYVIYLSDIFHNLCFSQEYLDNVYRVEISRLEDDSFANENAIASGPVDEQTVHNLSQASGTFEYIRKCFDTLISCELDYDKFLYEASHYCIGLQPMDKQIIEQVITHNEKIAAADDSDQDEKETGESDTVSVKAVVFGELFGFCWDITDDIARMFLKEGKSLDDFNRTVIVNRCENDFDWLTLEKFYKKFLTLSGNDLSMMEGVNLDTPTYSGKNYASIIPSAAEYINGKIPPLMSVDAIIALLYHKLHKLADYLDKHGTDSCYGRWVSASSDSEAVAAVETGKVKNTLAEICRLANQLSGYLLNWSEYLNGARLSREYVKDVYSRVSQAKNAYDCIQDAQNNIELLQGFSEQEKTEGIGIIQHFAGLQYFIYCMYEVFLKKLMTRDEFLNRLRKPTIMDPTSKSIVSAMKTRESYEKLCEIDII